MTAGKGSTAHFVWRCSNCKRESSAKFDQAPPQPYSADSNGQFSPLVVLDCRGLEFTGFDPQVTSLLISHSPFVAHKTPYEGYMEMQRDRIWYSLL